MKKILEQLLSDITYGVKAGIRKSNMEYKKQVQENLRNSITYAQQEMVNDLFLVFNNGNYGALKPVGSFQNIRPDGWFARGDVIMFRYRLLKDSCGRVSSAVLDSIRDNMNADLRLVQNTLFCTYGMDTYTLYPYLANGIKVLHTIDTDAEIIVVCTAKVNLWSY